MTEQMISPLRARMIEDKRMRGMGEKAQKSHIRAIKDFAHFLGHSPDTATPEELRAYQLHMTDTGVTASTFNVRIVALSGSGAFAAPLAPRSPPPLRDGPRAR